MITNLANVITNIIFSILFINLLPAPIKLMGLGLGSACASAVDSAIAVILRSASTKSGIFPQMAI